MPRTRKTIVKIDNSAPTLIIENGEVKQIAKPVIEGEVEDDVLEEEAEDEAPKWYIKTPNGDAVYEFVGNCIECFNEKKETPLFTCISYPIHANEQLGNQLSAFIREGPICQEHYRKFLGQQSRPTEITYKVIGGNKFG